MSLRPSHVWKQWFVFPDLLFHNMSLTNPGIVILESDRAIRKETNITEKTWRMFRSCADVIIWASNAAETSLSVQWKDANYLLHSRWWLFFFWAVIVSYTNFWMIVGNQFVQFPASFCFSAMFHSKLNSMCLLRVCLLAKTSWPVSSCIIQLHQGDSNFCGG